MAVMVTGIGHVGGYVVRDLLEADEQVVIYGFFGGTGGASNPGVPDLDYVDTVVGGGLRDKVRVVVGDIADLGGLVTAAERYDVTKIVHLASLLSSGVEANPPLAVRVNIVGTANVFEAATRLGMEKVAWASSVDVFGDRSVPASGIVTDDAPYDPPFIYGAGKVMCEQMAARYAANHGLDITGLRLTRVYGFGEHIKAARGGGSSWMSGLLYEPAVGGGAVVVPFGARPMDFLYLEDVASAFMKALAYRGAGATNYIINGDYRMISEAYEFVHRLFPDAPLRLSMEDIPLPAGSSLIWTQKFDSSRAAADLGHRSRFSMEEGFLRTINNNRASAGLPPVAEPAGLSR